MKNVIMLDGHEYIAKQVVSNKLEKLLSDLSREIVTYPAVGCSHGIFKIRVILEDMMALKGSDKDSHIDFINQKLQDQVDIINSILIEVNS